jgi:transcription antitermination factor NusG
MMAQRIQHTAPVTGTDLFELAEQMPDGQQWYVLHTRSRHEKALATDLQAMGVPCYLPTVDQVRFYGKRKAQVEMPLFPGYVFLFGERDQAFSADRTGRLAGIIDVADQQRLTWELRNIYLALDQQVPLDPYPYLRAGVRAEVRSGPLRGLQGIIESRTHTHRLILQVDMLGRAVSLELDGAVLEPLE